MQCINNRLSPIEIDNKIKEYRDLKQSLEKKLKEQIEVMEFKKSQNGNDMVEVQNIGDIISNLLKMIDRCDLEIDKYERMKLSCCEKKVERSLLRSNFYGY